MADLRDWLCAPWRQRIAAQGSRASQNVDAKDVGVTRGVPYRMNISNTTRLIPKLIGDDIKEKLISWFNWWSSQINIGSSLQYKGWSTIITSTNKGYFIISWFSNENLHEYRAGFRTQCSWRCLRTPTKKRNPSLTKESSGFPGKTTNHLQQIQIFDCQSG